MSECITCPKCEKQTWVEPGPDADTAWQEDTCGSCGADIEYTAEVSYSIMEVKEK